MKCVTAATTNLVIGVWQPEPASLVNTTSNVPVVVTNDWNTSSSGVNTVVFTYPANVNWPASTFTTNWWACGAKVWTTVTCTKSTAIASLGTDTLQIPTTPLVATQWTTLTFTATIVNILETPNTDNSSAVAWLATVAAADVTAPIISATSIANNKLIPTSAFSMVYTYSDSGWSGINTVSGWSVSLKKWDWVSAYGWELSPTYLSSSSLTTTTWTYNYNALPFWKYKLDFTIKDYATNTSTLSSTIFYIDEPSINISNGTLDMGTLVYGSKKFSTAELTITVTTVGAWFNVNMIQNSILTEWHSGNIIFWNSTKWVWYDKSPYTSTITSAQTNQVLSTQGASLNTNGLKNTYTYKIKYGALIQSADLDYAGNYTAPIGFTLNLDY